MVEERIGILENKSTETTQSKGQRKKYHRKKWTLVDVNQSNTSVTGDPEEASREI